MGVRANPERAVHRHIMAIGERWDGMVLVRRRAKTLDRTAREAEATLKHAVEVPGARGPALAAHGACVRQEMEAHPRPATIGVQRASLLRVKTTGRGGDEEQPDDEAQAARASR